MSLLVLKPVPSQAVCITEHLVLPFAISEQVPFLIMKKDAALCGSMEMFSHPHVRWCYVEWKAFCPFPVYRLQAEGFCA